MPSSKSTLRQRLGGDGSKAGERRAVQELPSAQHGGLDAAGLGPGIPRVVAALGLEDLDAWAIRVHEADLAAGTCRACMTLLLRLWLSKEFCHGLLAALECLRRAGW